MHPTIQAGRQTDNQTCTYTYIEIALIASPFQHNSVYCVRPPGVSEVLSCSWFSCYPSCLPFHRRPHFPWSWIRKDRRRHSSQFWQETKIAVDPFRLSFNGKLIIRSDLTSSYLYQNDEHSHSRKTVESCPHLFCSKRMSNNIHSYQRFSAPST